MCSPSDGSILHQEMVKTTATKTITPTERCGCGTRACARPSKAKIIAMTLTARRKALRLSDVPLRTKTQPSSTSSNTIRIRWRTLPAGDALLLPPPPTTGSFGSCSTIGMDFTGAVAALVAAACFSCAWPWWPCGCSISTLWCCSCSNPADINLTGTIDKHQREDQDHGCAHGCHGRSIKGELPGALLLPSRDPEQLRSSHAQVQSVRKRWALARGEAKSSVCVLLLRDFSISCVPLGLTILAARGWRLGDDDTRLGPPRVLIYGLQALYNMPDVWWLRRLSVHSVSNTRWAAAAPSPRRARAVPTTTPRRRTMKGAAKLVCSPTRSS